MKKGSLLFVFNFHPTKSFENYKVGTKWGSEHIIVLDTDDERFGGHNRLTQGHHKPFPLIKEEFNTRPFNFNLYIPARTAIVLTPV